MKISSYYLSVATAAIAGLIATPIVSLAASVIDINPAMVPNILNFGAILGTFTGLLSLTYLATVTASKPAQFAIAGAVSAALLSILLSSALAGGIFALILAALFGSIVGIGQYVGAKMFENSNISR